ncbi:MAG: DEAD/DEAH box helicase [Magnetococcales bacterium]|nr:DEAD/DEAH box helicase [Magnetococcales bacterium]
MKFTELDIPEPIMKGIGDAGFVECTPIQAMTLPVTLAGRDVSGQAHTGTGKTAAYLIAIFSRLLSQPTKALDPPRHKGRGYPRALIIAPTRELAVQIEQDALLLGKYTDLTVTAVYGGVNYDRQRDSLIAGDTDILVGTPGRLIDYLKQRTYSCRQIEALVIDEADRMFDMGFIADLRFMLRRMPSYEKRLSMLFSATLSYRAQELSYEYMNLPEVIAPPQEEMTADQVTQQLYHVSGKEKISLLVGLLRKDLADRTADAKLKKDEEQQAQSEQSDNLNAEESQDIEESETPVMDSRVMIFTNTKRMGETLVRWLNVNGFESGYLSGDVPQTKRLKILRRFQEGQLPVLIATDVAGRGLHINGVTHVINYDLPDNPEDYVHRIGRTARAGAKGDAITLVDEGGAYNLEALTAFIKQEIPVGWADESLFVDLKRPPYVPKDKKRSHSGKRRSSGPSSGNRNSQPGKKRSRHRKKKSNASQTDNASTEQNKKSGVSQQKQASEAGETKAGEVKKRRRRRRRKKSTVSKEGAQTQQGSADSQ